MTNDTYIFFFSYNELKAPRDYSINNEKMILSDITFVNKRLYMTDNNLVGVNHIEQQDKQASRSELIVSKKKNMALKNKILIYILGSFG